MRCCACSGQRRDGRRIGTRDHVWQDFATAHLLKERRALEALAMHSLLEQRDLLRSVETRDEHVDPLDW